MDILDTAKRPRGAAAPAPRKKPRVAVGTVVEKVFKSVSATRKFRGAVVGPAANESGSRRWCVFYDAYGYVETLTEAAILRLAPAEEDDDEDDDACYSADDIGGGGDGVEALDASAEEVGGDGVEALDDIGGVDGAPVQPPCLPHPAPLAPRNPPTTNSQWDFFPEFRISRPHESKPDIRRAKNREAAERMRVRRREEVAALKARVTELASQEEALTAEEKQLEAEFARLQLEVDAAAEAKEAALRALQAAPIDSTDACQVATPAPR